MKDLQEYLRKIEEIILQGPYKDQWDSLSKHPVPQWFKKAKFGCSFIGESIVCRHLETNGTRERCI